jgi:hypothetical protein
LSRTFKVVLDLITVQFLFKYGTKPIYLFGKFAMISFFMSFLAFAWATYLKFSGQQTYIETPLPLAAVTMFMLGFMVILMGLLAELMVRTYHEAQGKATYTVRAVYDSAVDGAGGDEGKLAETADAPVPTKVH